MLYTCVLFLFHECVWFYARACIGIQTTSCDALNRAKQAACQTHVAEAEM